MPAFGPRGRGLWTVLAVLVLGACQGVPVTPPDTSVFDERDQYMRERFGTLFGEDALVFRAGRARSPEAAGGAGIGVNAYLWRATLETLDFLPLASADPFGGLIITEWYQPADAPNERLKLQILIRDTVLRADAIRVSVFRQERQPDGSWLDVEVRPELARELEDRILTRARQLRIAAMRAGA